MPWWADEEADRLATPDEMAEEFPEDESERREWEQDPRERDGFSEHVRRRDKDKTKKVIKDHSSKALGPRCHSGSWSTTTTRR